MQIDPPRLPPTTATVVGASAAPRGWQAGQVLQATTLSAAAAGENVQLRIGGETIQARLNQAVAAGQDLMVRILAVRPKLRIAVEPPRPPVAGGRGERPAAAPATIQASPQASARTTAQATSGSGAIPGGRSAVQPQTAPATTVQIAATGHGAVQPSGRESPVVAATPPVRPYAAESVTALATQTRALLPAQEGVARLMMLLTAAAGRGDLPPPLRASIAQIMKAVLPASQAGDATQLRQAVRDSGIFLEARLAQAVVTGRPPAGLEGDLKALLLRLAAAIPEGETKGNAPPRPPGDPPPPTRDSAPVPQPRATELPPMARETLIAALKQSVAGALARTGLHQIATAEQGPEGQRWLLELPLRAAGVSHDIVHMLLEREARRGGGAAARRWTALIALDLPGLGAVNARITVGGKNEVATWLWSDNTETADRVRAGLPRLQEALAARDLNVTGIGCRTDGPGKAEPSARGGNSSSLVDTEA